MSFDHLATEMSEGTITRGRAIKLAGAALAGSALSVFAATEKAEARRICGRRQVRCTARRRNGTLRRFCCPRSAVNVTTCRTAILRGLCVRIGS